MLSSLSVARPGGRYKYFAPSASGLHRHPAPLRAIDAKTEPGLVEFRADPASVPHDANFDRAKTIVAYCASGGRLALLRKTLHDMGYGNLCNLNGFKGWFDAGGDVDKA